LGGFPRSVTETTLPELASIGGANLDGQLGDELITLGGDGMLTTLRFDASLGGFVVVSEVAATMPATKFDLGDMNQDGNPDIALMAFGSATVDLMLGDGAGSFRRSRVADEAVSPGDASIGDYNDDGFADVAVLDVLLRNSGGQPKLPGSAVVLDLNASAEDVLVTVDVTQNVDFGLSRSPFDVNGDLRLSAQDALIVINRLSAAATSDDASAGLAETDVNRDGRTSANDALLIINELSRSSARAQAESIAALRSRDAAAEDDRLASIDLLMASEGSLF
jgi:hypothetical protein